MKIFNLFNKNNKAEVTHLSSEEISKSQNSSQSDSHDVKNNKIRLFYAEYEYFDDDTNNKKYDVTLGVSPQFILPNGMTMEDAYKIASYECINMAQRQGVAVESELTVTLASEQLNKYGFIPEQDSNISHIRYVTDNIQTPFPEMYQAKANTQDLFLVGGDYSLFKKSINSKRFVKWLKTGVTKKDVDKICEKLQSQDSQPEL